MISSNGFQTPYIDPSIVALRELSVGKYRTDRSFAGILCHKTGVKPDWSELPAIRFTCRKGTDNDKDFSGFWQMAWNEQFFFLRVTVKDDKFVHEEYAVPGKRWNNDSLQIFFDTFCNARSKKLNSYDQDDYDYNVFPNTEGTAARLWRNQQPDMQLTLGTKTPPSFSFADDVKTTFTKVPDGYVYEVAFPAKYLLPIQLKKGYFFGFGLFVNDRDGKGVKASLTIADDGKGCYNRPKNWPVVVLTE